MYQPELIKIGGDSEGKSPSLIHMELVFWPNRDENLLENKIPWFLDISDAGCPIKQTVSAHKPDWV
jgi:hypothetical protein